jgi:hypothetical protein
MTDEVGPGAIRHRLPARRGRRWSRRLLVVAAIAMLLPVPWQHKADSSLGLAWRLDNRLIVNGERLDPPGRYSWLTVGRPALVGELLWGRIRPGAHAGRPVARDLRVGSVTSRPAHVEAVAAAVGLVRSGRDLTLGLEVRISGRLVDDPDLPSQARLTHVNGHRLTDRVAWQSALADTPADGRLTFRTAAGTAHVAPEGHLPYQRIEVIDLAPAGLTAAVGGHGPPYSWVRSMAMGASHGLMVGVATYAAVAGEDLAAGRHIAGTGRLFGDGTVGTIGGLRAKAGAARRAGADVMLLPASQLHLLDDFDPGPMRLLPVSSIDDAIAQLRATAGR